VEELLPHACSPALQQGLPLLVKWCHGSKSKWFGAAALGVENCVGGLQFQPWTSSRLGEDSASGRGNIARSRNCNT